MLLTKKNFKYLPKDKSIKNYFEKAFKRKHQKRNSREKMLAATL